MKARKTCTQKGSSVSTSLKCASILKNTSLRWRDSELLFFFFSLRAVAVDRLQVPHSGRRRGAVAAKDERRFLARATYVVHGSAGCYSEASNSDNISIEEPTRAVHACLFTWNKKRAFTGIWKVRLAHRCRRRFRCRCVGCSEQRTMLSQPANPSPYSPREVQVHGAGVVSAS